MLVHAFGAVMDNPDLFALAVVGDGEAETGPLEGSWKGISFLNPERDGAVLPILHLNGAKIAGPTVLARKDPAEVRSLLEGHGYEVIEVDGRRPARDARPVRGGAGACLGRDPRHPGVGARRGLGRHAAPLAADRAAHTEGVDRPRGGGWRPVAGTWRAHQVPLVGVRGNEEHLRLLETWLRSYRPEELFDDDGTPDRAGAACQPGG